MKIVMIFENLRNFVLKCLQCSGSSCRASLVYSQWQDQEYWKLELIGAEQVDTSLHVSLLARAVKLFLSGSFWFVVSNYQTSIDSSKYILQKLHIVLRQLEGMKDLPIPSKCQCLRQFRNDLIFQAVLKGVGESGRGCFTPQHYTKTPKNTAR